jgi:hypothetical protein
VRAAHAQPQIVKCSFRLHSQTAVARILQLLGAYGERNVDGAGGHGIGCSAQSLGSRRAHILHPADGDAIQAQRRGRRNGGIPHIDAIEAGPGPRRFDLPALDARIRQRFIERFGQKSVGPDIPTLTEARATHPDDRNFVLDTCSHRIILTKRLAPLSRSSGKSLASGRAL